MTFNTTRPPFARSICACDADRAFCKRQPAHLIPSDIDRIAARLPDVNPAEYLCASKGAVIMDVVTTTLIRIPTITPASDDTGRCVFLTADERCAIHDVAPFGCAYFSVHENHEDGTRRSLWGLKEIMRAPAYQQLRDTLPPSKVTPHSLKKEST